MGVEPGKEIKLDPPAIFRYLGIVDMQAVYQHIVTWMQNNGMVVQQKVYKDKPGNQDTREIEISLVGTVHLDEYTQWSVTANLKMLDSRKLKEKGDFVYSGRLQASFEGAVVPDYNRILTKSPLQKVMGKLLLFIRKKDKEELFDKKKLRERVLDLANQCKKIIGMDSI